MRRRRTAGPCSSTAARAPRPRSRSLGSPTSWLPSLDEALDGLPAPRRRALEVALLLAEPQDGGSPNVRAIGMALLDVLRALAERGPVLLALDDVQWLDVSSAAVLSVALRRLGDEPVAVLGTMRTEAGAVVPEALAGLPLERLTLEPLDLATVHRLLRDRLGLELPRPQLARIHRAAGGNPYFALELARDGGDHVPDSLREVLGQRLDRLSPDVLALLLDAAALASSDRAARRWARRARRRGRRGDRAPRRRPDPLHPPAARLARV